MEANKILFAAFFFWDRISFHWQQYKRKHNANSFISVMWNKFKAFLRQNLDDLQAFIDTY